MVWANDGNSFYEAEDGAIVQTELPGPGYLYLYQQSSTDPGRN